MIQAQFHKIHRARRIRTDKRCVCPCSISTIRFMAAGATKAKCTRRILQRISDDSLLQNCRLHNFYIQLNDAEDKHIKICLYLQ